MTRSDDKLSQLIRPEVQALKAYHVPPSRGLIKLDAMENPYTWSPALTDQWLARLREVSLNRYPDPSVQELRAPLHKVWNVPAGMELLFGNGSDELIQLILMACARPGAVALAPSPSFVMYAMTAEFVGMRFVPVPLGENFKLDRDAMLRAIREHRPAVVFIAYPNNPTGNLFEASDIEAILRETDGFVVVDEAYHPFCQESFLDRLGQHDNLLVMRTLSKLGLAGLRLGALIGAPDWLHEFDKLRLPYNINSLTQASVQFALEHVAVLDEQAARIRQDREILFAALAAMPGIKPWASRANFILFRVDGRSATDVYQQLRHRHVLVKNLDAAGGPLAGCLRVTVGTPAENEVFLAALEKSI
jgi:histidinol-phosphate aminotransferase